MRPSLAANQPYTGIWTFNTDPAHARRVVHTRFVSRFQELAGALGVVFRGEGVPAGHHNPETKDTPVGAFTSRNVITLQCWFSVPSVLNAALLNRAAATALRDSMSDTGLSIERLGTGLDNCESLAEWYRSPMLNVVNLAFLTVDAAAFGDVCAEYRSFNAGETAPSSSLNSVVARATAEPIVNSSNPNLIGQKQEILNPGGGSSSTWTTTKVVAAIGLGIVGIIAVGYTVRSFKLAVG